MSTDLKADLLHLLEGCQSKKLSKLAARVKSATITEPPPPDPCVVTLPSLRARRSNLGNHLLTIEDESGYIIRINRTEAAALIPALQAFIGDVREGGQ